MCQVQGFAANWLQMPCMNVHWPTIEEGNLVVSLEYVLLIYLQMKAISAICKGVLAYQSVAGRALLSFGWALLQVRAAEHSSTPKMCCQMQT